MIAFFIKGRARREAAVLISEGLAGLGLALYVLLLKPRPAFAAGLMVGYGIGATAVLAFIFIGRMRGSRGLGEMDERERAMAGRAALLALFSGILLLAAFVLTAFALPALMGLKAVHLASIALAYLSAAYGISYLVFARRT